MKNFNGFHSDNRQPESDSVLQELENIDDDADNLGISFVKINDIELVEELGLQKLPSLVYYRSTSPILYEGE